MEGVLHAVRTLDTYHIPSGTWRASRELLAVPRAYFAIAAIERVVGALDLLPQ